MMTEEQMRDALRQCPHDTVENLRVRWLYAKDFARAIESAACAERDARIAELEKWQAEHWNALEIINNYFVSKDLLLVVEDGGPDAAARNIVHSVAALEQQLDVMAKNTEAQAHASVMREIELTEKVEKLTRELEEARQVLKAARECLTATAFFSEEQAPSVVAAIDAAIKEQT